jgi:light-independent protochlorophyllide reductase subunit L
VRLGGVIANRSADTDQIDKLQLRGRDGSSRAASADLDAIRRSRLKKCTIFEMDRHAGSADGAGRIRTDRGGAWRMACPQLPATPLKDREIFDLLGYD